MKRSQPDKQDDTQLNSLEFLNQTANDTIKELESLTDSVAQEKRPHFNFVCKLLANATKESARVHNRMVKENVSLMQEVQSLTKKLDELSRENHDLLSEQDKLRQENEGLKVKSKSARNCKASSSYASDDESQGTYHSGPVTPEKQVVGSTAVEQLSSSTPRVLWVPSSVSKNPCYPATATNTVFNSSVSNITLKTQQSHQGVMGAIGGGQSLPLQPIAQYQQQAQPTRNSLLITQGVTNTTLSSGPSSVVLRAQQSHQGITGAIGGGEQVSLPLQPIAQYQQQPRPQYLPQLQHSQLQYQQQGGNNHNK